METEIIREALRRSEEFLEGVAERPVLSDPGRAEIRDHLRRRYLFDEPVPASDLVGDVGGMLERWATHVVHPRYFGYFNPTPTPAAVAADLMVAAFNPQMAVWSHAPAAVEMEQHVLRWLMGRFGLPVETGGAHFTSGGAEANLTAVIAALTSRFPTYGVRGLRGIGESPLLYHSAGAHDSFTKICHMTGLGRSALRIVPVDGSLRMDMAALEGMMDQDAASGGAPFMIVATAGTTAAGVIDPLGEAAELCRRRGLWLHVDAAWGGAAIVSDRLREHLSGIGEADSVTCDAHKWLNVTMGAGMFFCRDARILREAFRVATDYMPGLTEGVVDPYVTSVQWSRRLIGLKLFMSLAHLGAGGYAKMIERQAETGGYLERRLEEAGWIHVSRSPLPVCCVTHPAIEAGQVGLDQALQRILRRGRSWISKVRLGGREALRACVCSYRTTEKDIDLLVEEMNAAVAG